MQLEPLYYFSVRIQRIVRLSFSWKPFSKPVLMKLLLKVSFMDPRNQWSYPLGLQLLLLTMRLRSSTSARRLAPLHLDHSVAFFRRTLATSCLSKGVRETACVTTPIAVVQEY